MKIDWIKKLTSRKFWAAVVGFATAILVYKGADSGTVESTTALIMAGATVIAYILGEGFVDAAGASATVILPEDKNESEKTTPDE